VSLIKINRYHE